MGKEGQDKPGTRDLGGGGGANSKQTLTFFDDAQVVGLGLHDAFQALDVAREVLDLGLVELGC
jgi:hypothetical protein